MVLNEDPTVWLDGARPTPRYLSKYLGIKIAELYTNAVQYGNKMKLINSFAQGITRLLIISPYVGSHFYSQKCWRGD
jgi:hypothetical protein